MLVRAGYTVKWLDNQSGCKGVCQGAGIEYEKIEPATAPELCIGDECHDEILVRRLLRRTGAGRAPTRCSCCT